MFNKEDLIKDLKSIGVLESDTLMVHSAYSKIKDIEGGVKTVIESLIEVVNKGLLLFPTHTWATMKNDNDIMDKKEKNSCVGYLTNEAISFPGFLRSNHPTHSVVAYGKNNSDYIKDDDYSTTPVSPNGSFGKLKDNGKILFLGAPLTKNTFVHSVEEEMNVPDRFTDKIYTFYTKCEDGKKMKFKMPRHFSTKHPHISENYEKLLPIMLEKGIANEGLILNTKSYLVDASKLRILVIDILKKDIHAFDDERDVRVYVE